MSAVEVTNLKKYFGHIKAVDDISFSIEKGECFGFLGPNGAGKTTTIRMMMDFVRPTSGTLSILGMDAKRDSVKLNDVIGYLSSDVHFYDGWTGQDHINFVLHGHGKKTDTPILHKLLADFDFDPLRKVKHLSTGNKQKLGIILALVTEPQLLILDEPTRGLDPLLQNTFYEWLHTFRQRGSTIFMSSHNLAEVEHLCDRVGIIKNGKLIAVERLEDIRRKQIHVVTLVTEGKIDATQFALPNVTITAQSDHRIVCKVKGEIQPILTVINQLAIKDLEVTHASLEEAFLEMYDGDKETV